jgi:hypothetical protein
MKNIRIFILDACYDIWLEVRKILCSDGFVNLKVSCPRNAMRVCDTTPDDTEKFFSILIGFCFSNNFPSNHDFRCFTKPMKHLEIILLAKNQKIYEKKCTSYHFVFEHVLP